MRTNTKARTSVIFLLFLFGLFGCSAPLRATVRISESELQAKADGEFPIRKELLLAELELLNPKVKLIDGQNAVDFQVDARFALGPLVRTGTLGARANLRYDEDEGAFYLTRPEITRFDISAIPQEHERTVREATELALAASLPLVPVHRLDSPLELLIRSVRVERGSVVVEMGL